MAAPSREERAWIRGAQSGSASALEALFVVHDGAAAEDIAQEAFLAAVRNLDRFDRRRPFGPWLHRIVVNRAIDWARARSLRRETGRPLFGEWEDDTDEHVGLENPVPEDIAGGLRSLSPEHRAVIVLRYFLDYTPGEIAELLDLPRGTVNSRLRRGLDRLEDILDRRRP